MNIDDANRIIFAICKRCIVETQLLRVWLDRDGRTINATIYTLKQYPDDIAPRLAAKGLRLHKVSVVDRDTFLYEMTAV